MLNLLLDFRDSVSISNRLIAAAHALDKSGAYVWPEADRDVVVEAAFLKLFIAWESIQEKAFIEFMMGSVSATGNSASCFASPSDRTHAGRMLVGLGRFVDWSTPEQVRKLAKNYLLNGHPFESVLTSVNSDLLDIKTIRNSAAHLSSSTAQQLDALASRKLGRSVSGYSAARLLMTVDPNSAAGETIFDSYALILDTAALGITHI